MKPEQRIFVQRLREAGFDDRRFVTVGRDKKNHEEAWDTRPLYTPDDLIAQGNTDAWGVPGRDGLIIIDVDKPEMNEILAKIIPPTFETRSPRRGLPHRYIKVTGGKIDNLFLNLPGHRGGAGEIRAQNWYAVAPGTHVDYIDENGVHVVGDYTINQDRPITTIQYDQFMQAIIPYLGKDPTQKLTTDIMKNGVPAGERHAYGIKLATRLQGFEGLDPEAALISMRHWNSKNQPPMSDEDIIRMVKDAAQYLATNPQDQTHDTPRAEDPDDKGAKTRIQFLEYLDKKYLFYCDQEDENLNVYYWNEKRWISKTEALTLSELAEYFQTTRPPLSKDAILDYYRGKGQQTKIVVKPPHIIAFKNGLLNINTDEFIPPEPNIFAINIIPHNYDKTAKAPKWEQFIREIHHPEDINFVQEWWGYNLYSAVTRKALYIAIGQTNTGKTVEFETISQIIGYDNVTTVSLQQLTYDAYAVAEFHYKLANIADDITSQTIAYSGTLKTLADGGRVRVREIYGKPFDMNPYAKITDSCNEPPEIKDESDAVWERLKFVEYPNVFSFNPDTAKGEHQARDKIELENSLLEEAPGILNWMIQGLKRLKNNGWKFSYNKSTDQVREYYRRVSKPVTSWIDEELKFTGQEDDLIAKEELYPDFDRWRKENKIKNIITKDKFFKELRTQELTFQRLREYERHSFLVGYVLSTRPRHKRVSGSRKLDSTVDRGEQREEEGEDREEHTEEERDSASDLRTDAPTPTVPSSLMSRFESFVQERLPSDVGYGLVMEALGLSKDLFFGLMNSPGCRVRWNTRDATVVYDDNREKEKQK